jgi:hypothetical protein
VVPNDAGMSYALIGGLALSPHGVVRGTADIDLLLDAAEVGKLDIAELREYFQFFDREQLLSELLGELDRNT